MTIGEWIIKYFFPIRLKALRELRDINQNYLAVRLGVNQRTISNWEKGKAEPSLSKLIQLTFHLKVEIEYLMCLDEETYAILKKAVKENFDTVITDTFHIDYLQRIIQKITLEYINPKLKIINLPF